MLVAEDAWPTPAAQVGGGGTKKWFVLQTLSRQEKAVVEDAQRSGPFCYLPLVSMPRIYGKRKLNVQLPVFPGYVFLYGTRDEAFAVDRAGRIAKIISVVDQQRLHQDLTNFRRALSSGMGFDPYPFLTSGRRVEVTAGVLKGVEGLVADRVSPTRLVLQIETLGRAVSVEVDAGLLRSID